MVVYDLILEEHIGKEKMDSYQYNIHHLGTFHDVTNALNAAYILWNKLQQEHEISETEEDIIATEDINCYYAKLKSKQVRYYYVVKKRIVEEF